MKLLMVFANGFEDVEAIATRDVLIRGGIEVVDATINEDGNVTASHKINLTGLKRLSDLDLSSFEGIILPGGSLGVQNLLRSDLVDKVVKEFYSSNHLVCAICAAPMVLAKAGILKGKRFTCYPGCEVGLDGIYTGEEVVVLDKIITGRSMLYSVPFGLAILEKLKGKEIRDKIYRQIAGIK